MRRKIEYKWVMFSNVSSHQCFELLDLVEEVGCEKKRSTDGYPYWVRGQLVGSSFSKISAS